MDKGEDFLLYKLPCNELFTSGEYKEIVIRDRLGDDFGLPIDDIDQIVLLELIQPIRYTLLIKKLKTYLDDDVTDAEIDDFISLINDRITFFASKKVLSITE